MKLEDFDFRIWDGSEEEYIKKETKNSNKYSIVHDSIGYAVGLIGDAKNVYTIESGVTSHEWGYDDYEMVENYCIDESICEIELWTGFRDKGGVKIYEGDILNFRGKNYLVEFNKHLELSVICRTKDSVYGMHTSKGNFKNCKVVGNIHENKELLDV
ncbi:hypothetical protein B6S12_09770 [Helicobacter valdiviensis]|uniref:YopX protein domain-containing protein n=1 Tax=Helicobacter valdiviensis TaxID=1458358 RepID=A0A2W6MTM7_9HELI|nr:YopX family protein [Helicobacter valdiviensis]PZT47311.1 hypothetical protein B6S12_09770 [Helicobacter valdiviensis]